MSADLSRCLLPACGRKRSLRMALKFCPTMQMFVYLQILDVLTTLIGLRIGCAEANPFISHLMQVGPLAGLFISKLFVFGVAVLWLWTGRQPRAIWHMNYGFAGLVIWNLYVLV